MIVGVLQWLVLRPYLPQANWWLLVHIGTLALVAAAIVVVNSLIILAGTLYGAFSGYALVSFLRIAYPREGNSAVESSST